MWTFEKRNKIVLPNHHWPFDGSTWWPNVGLTVGPTYSQHDGAVYSRLGPTLVRNVGPTMSVLLGQHWANVCMLTWIVYCRISGGCHCIWLPSRMSCNICGDCILSDNIPVTTIELPKILFQTLLTYPCRRSFIGCMKRSLNTFEDEARKDVQLLYYNKTFFTRQLFYNDYYLYTSGRFNNFNMTIVYMKTSAKLACKRFLVSWTYQIRTETQVHTNDTLHYPGRKF